MQMWRAASFPFRVPSDILTQEPGAEFFPGLWLCSPLHDLSALSNLLERQTDKPSISLLGEECETQSPLTMETKTAKKAVVWCRTSQRWGNGAPEKWAAVTVKITVLGRDGGTWGSQKRVGRGSAMWPRCPMSHLGHEQVPTLPMVGVGGLMCGSGGRRGWRWPPALLLP